MGAVSAVIFVRTLVDGNFDFIGADRDGCGEELVTAVTIGVLQQ